MKKVKNDVLDVVFLLDRSGSMANCVNDTIGGYNSYLNEQRKNSNTKITTILFDDKYEVLYNREDIKKVKDITNKEYFVRGATALMDAIGKTIDILNSVKNKVLFVITTDGYENASKMYNKNQIKEMIVGHKNWEFIYIGANIDSYNEGNMLGIKRKNISNYVKSENGIKCMFKSISKATDCMLVNDELDYSWKEDLEVK